MIQRKKFKKYLNRLVILFFIINFVKAQRPKTTKYKINNDLYNKLAKTVPPRIYTDSGFVDGITQKEGTATNSKLRSKYYYPTVQYLGVPYAAPPVGNYRWMKPQPPNPWKLPMNCTRYKPICPQNLKAPYMPRNLLPKVYTKMVDLNLQEVISNSNPNVEDKMSEDCLYVNIIVPAKFYNKETEAPDNYISRLAVMVHIHGYSWSEGSASWFDPAPIAALGNVIVVNFNYRLGPLGFLKFANMDANYGLHDQLTAIRWVKNNIAKFGGDENKITLFGSGAGAVSINNLQLTDYGANGLYTRMILQSGTSISPWSTSAKANLNSHETFVKLSGCGGFEMPRDRLTCMRKVSWSDLYLPKSDIDEWTNSFPQNTLIFGPIIDEKLVLTNTSKLQDNGEFLATDLLIGFNINDGKQFSYKLKPKEPDPEDSVPFDLAIDYITSSNPQYKSSPKRADIGNLIKTFYRVYDKHLSTFDLTAPSVTSNIFKLHSYNYPKGMKSDYQIINLFTDYQFIAPFYKQVKNQQTYNANNSNFGYLWNITVIKSSGTNPFMAEEDYYLFGHPFGNRRYPSPFDDKINSFDRYQAINVKTRRTQSSTYSDMTKIDIELSKMVITYFTNFAKTGNPNNSGDGSKIVSLNNWPPYSNGKNILSFSRKGQKLMISTVDDYRRVCQKFWNEFLPQYLSSSSGVDLNFLQNYTVSHIRPRPLEEMAMEDSDRQTRVFTEPKEDPDAPKLTSIDEAAEAESEGGSGRKDVQITILIGASLLCGNCLCFLRWTYKRKVQRSSYLGQAKQVKQRVFVFSNVSCVRCETLLRLSFLHQN